MHSIVLAEFLRSGVIPPLTFSDPKPVVEAKLGAPSTWKGKNGPDFAWAGPALRDFRESDAWHYGSLAVSFSDLGLVEGMSIDYSPSSVPAVFHDPFADLPKTAFRYGELIAFLRERKIAFTEVRGRSSSELEFYTEGGVKVWPDAFANLDHAEVHFLYSQPDKKWPNRVAGGD